MDQKAHIEQLINASVENLSRDEEIQKSYRQCIKKFEDIDFTNLINELEFKTLPWVRKQLWKNGCYSNENEHTVLQTSREAVWNVIIKDSQNLRVRETFAIYAFGIYKKKTFTVIRETTKTNKKAEIHLFSEKVGNTGKTQEDILAAEEVNFIEQEELREMYDEIFCIYCMTFLNSSSPLVKNLALYYARVLPHLLREIPDTKATSAKKAFDRMKDRAVEDLKSASEKMLQRDINSELSWNKDVERQLNSELEIIGKKILLKDVIYTDVYDKGKIENWAEYLHKVTIAIARESILKDKDLVDIIKTYISQDDKLYCFIKEGESR